jgi:hypothetical protein
MRFIIYNLYQILRSKNYEIMDDEIDRAYDMLVGISEWKRTFGDTA